MTSTNISESRPSGTGSAARTTLRLKRLGIDTHQEAVVYMHIDCSVCRSEGFAAHARVRVSSGERSIIATLNQVASDLLTENEASLSEAGWRQLGVREGDEITVSHPGPVESLGRVRGKIFGRPIPAHAFHEIVGDIIAGRYSDIDLASFITACAARGLDRQEMTAFTKAMVDTGETLRWTKHPIADKHCVGGLPGNRTTPVVVAIAAACGLTIPKTSSRAITSPAGTADAMETLAPVDLDIPTMREVVEREGGCIVWGGSVHLSPADELMIRVERALDLDSEAQLVASVISKKVAAGSTHLVVDLPIGATAKVRGPAAADTMVRALTETAAAFGLHASVVVTDGSQPVGRGIGPALEARDVLDVLRGTPNAPGDLRQRSIKLAGALLEMVGTAPQGAGEMTAEAVLHNGRAWDKFQRICEAQGGMRVPPVARFRREIASPLAGRVAAIDNRRIARVAKLSGAPEAKAAGVDLHVRIGDVVAAGDPLYSIHAESPGELDYALDYAAANRDVVYIGED
jgi:thymidine phosphorylase